jgi:hypothetical protein
MKQFMVVSVALLCLNLTAENLYVTPSGAGATNGSNWSNAFAGFSDVQWGSGSGRVGPGDILYVAGGNYSSGTDPGVNGTDDNNRIIIRKATESAHGTSTGWQASYGNQAKVQIGLGGCSYITVDGVYEYGFYWEPAAPCGYCSGMYLKDAKNITVQYAHVDGTNDGNSWRGINAVGGTNITLRHLKISNCPNDAFGISGSNFLMEYCRVGPKITSKDGYHADLVETNNTQNVVFRYNIVNWGGQMFQFTNDVNYQIYGNVFTGVEVLHKNSKYDGANPLYFYNNTVYKVTTLGNNAVTAKNNIFYQTGNAVATGNVIVSTDIFVNSAGGDVLNGDFHLKATAGARDIGTDLGSPYNLDPDGNTRGADGKWDMGAFEYTNTGVSWRLAEGSWQAQALPSLVYNCKLQTANCQLFSIQGQRVNDISRSGIYLVPMGGKLGKVTRVK